MVFSLHPLTSSAILMFFMVMEGALMMSLAKLALASVVLLSGQVMAEPFRVGIGGHPQAFPGTADEYVSLMKEYKFNSTRIDYYWSQIEKNKGVFDPRGNKIEDVIQKSKENGISPLIILGYDNGLYFKGKPKTQQNYNDFANYAGWVTHHFKGVSNTFEIWNEWSTFKVSLQEGHSQKSADDYFNLVKTASLNIKKNNPNARVIAGSFNPLRRDEKDWADKLINLGILNYIDGFSVHPYFFKNYEVVNPDQVLSGIDAAQKEFKKIAGTDKDIPIYITEIGIPSNADFHGMNFNDEYIANYSRTLISKAKKVPYIKGVWWYDLYDDGGSKKYSEHNFGVIDRNMKPKPTALSIKSLSE
ncbi:TPA: hypothetical protein MHU31_09910 [Klebsiella pneumoniae]|nr:hypothetical protein [Klebsiella pneumoniae]